jgi:hypothetical protein
MRAVDSSVVIAAFATWHEHHAIARKAMAGRPRLVAHAAVESYSVLTRLPPPHRAHPSIVHAFTPSGSPIGRQGRSCSTVAPTVS